MRIVSGEIVQFQTCDIVCLQGRTVIIRQIISPYDLRITECNLPDMLAVNTSYPVVVNAFEMIVRPQVVFSAIPVRGRYALEGRRERHGTREDGTARRSAA